MPSRFTTYHCNRIGKVCLLLGGLILIGCGQQPTEPPTAATPPVSESTESAIAPTPSAPPAPSAAATTGQATPLPKPQLATLTAQDPTSQINVRSRPTVNSTAQGYGLVGDVVRLTQTAQDEEQATWYYAIWPQSGTAGWIRSDFIDTQNAPDDTDSTTAIQIDTYTTDELYAVGSGGCGMSLRRLDADASIFFAGLETTDVWMKLNGQMTQLRKTSAFGETFYGQATTQSFTNLDGLIQVEVNVTPGAQRDQEVIDIDQGTLRLEGGGEVIEIPVQGDAGC